jgi:hypothetical protein
MTSKHKEKNSSDRKPREEIARAVTEKAKDGQITCAAAHSIAERMDAQPEEIGHAADFLGLRLTKCQLGLFGYGAEKKKVAPAAEVPPALRQAIESSIVNGRLGCAAAWKIAKELQLKRMEVSSACEAMKIKLSTCQLGAF